jgi:sec-independent protein translocase protein TatA
MSLLTIATLFSGGHFLILGLVVLLLFGGKKIPELMGGIGKGMKEFKKSIKDDETADPKKDETAEPKKEVKE